jgi:predicted nucleic acid-binding protein
MEFIGKYSKDDWGLLAKKYDIKLIRTISLETLASTATRIEKAFAGTGRNIKRPDALNAAGAFLRNQKLVTADLGLFKRAKDLGLKVDFAGTGKNVANAAAYVPDPVTIPLR